MQVHEFYRNKGAYCKDWLGGRWLWHDTTPSGGGGIEWIDLFGKRADNRFRFRSPYYFENPTPLTLRFVLLHSYDEETKKYGLQVAELDWSDYSSMVGEMVIGDNSRHTLLVDRRVNIDFLFYSKNSQTDQIELFQWRLNAEERRVQRVGEEFHLPFNKFNRLDLNNGVICGISASLGTVSLFNVSRRQLLSEMRLDYLPKSIEKRNPSLYDPVVLTDNHFYFCSTTGDNWEKRSRIWHVDLKSGHVSAFSHEFDGGTRKMSIGPEGYLYVVVAKLLHEKGPITHSDGVTIDIGSRYWHMFKFARIPLKRPESLLFLSVVANPAPLPEKVCQLLDGRNDMPRKLFRRTFEVDYFNGCRQPEYDVQNLPDQPSKQTVNAEPNEDDEELARLEAWANS
ncbi:hypothetical protein M3Y98_00323500 [Aphelenchoides besseyi]|nr:hypothetical protein M3Y98_00323500 [Aphelenchoides besseyi]KAI6201433.1 hypothetical protein M3Y96_00841300 [Aphelenchoides besseyi]